MRESLRLRLLKLSLHAMHSETIGPAKLRYKMPKNSKDKKQYDRILTGHLIKIYFNPDNSI